jgi:hypothetical protein
MRLAVSLAFVCCFGFTSIAEAQLCGGQTSFSQGPYQLGIAGAFTDGAQGAGGHFAVGSPTGLFGGVGASVLGYSGLDSTRTEVSVFGGADLAVEGSSRVFVCPLGLVSFGTGPDIGPVDVSSVGLRGGGSVGVVASETRSLMVVPTFGLAAAWQRVSIESGGQESSASDTFGVATLGVGFIFNRNVAITPSIAIPFSVADSDVVFTLAFTFGFGR